MPLLNSYEESRKQKALDIISEITSARNPRRIEAFEDIIGIFGEQYEDIRKKSLPLSPLNELFHEIKLNANTNHVAAV